MTGKTLDFNTISQPDKMGTEIANKWVEWDSYRGGWKEAVKEVRNYIYARDTTTTTNKKLPWKNSTTIPKLCQIRDNLHANYMMTLFPKRKWLTWLANEKSANSKAKRDAIVPYMAWTSGQEQYKTEMSKLVLDYIDNGNCFATIEWIDQRSKLSEPSGVQVGYVGPSVRRISPFDIVFNPTAPSFIEAPKIVRSLVSIGELKQIIESQSSDENKEAYNDLYNYLIELRSTCRDSMHEVTTKDAWYQMDGFTSFRAYLSSDMVEILTFYGDLFDWETKEYLPNHKIMVVDRHKVISKKPNPSYFGYPPIFHCGWRPRQDNLWAMSPLENLVGLQYRIDHIENLKADVFDLITFPPLKIKGYVDDFTWGPFERIYIGDEGDVEMLAPPFQVLTANQEISTLMQLMEEMAGAPREAMGFRSPGEKTAYEVSRMENAASRIFNNKILQFSEFEEKCLNAMLEYSRRNLSDVVSFPVYDEDFNVQIFASLTPADITGAGQIKPMAARHFAERAELIQNMTQFYTSAIGQDPEIRVHISGVKMAQLAEVVLDVEEYGVFQPYVRIGEQLDAQRLMQAGQQQVQAEGMTPTGMGADSDQPLTPAGNAPPEAIDVQS